jgi:hypothetical protein
MSKHRFRWAGVVTAGIACAVAAVGAPRVEAADTSKGSVVLNGKTTQLQFVYLVKGPDVMSTTIRELVFSPTDIAAKIQACATLSCVSGQLDEGMTVDFDAGPRLNYWVVANGQRVQYSGTTEVSAFKASTDGPGKLAGTLDFDDSGAGGGKVNVSFDASLFKEFPAVH